MTVQELIKLLLDHPMDWIVYVGKGMGPVQDLRISNTDPDVSRQPYVVISP